MKIKNKLMRRVLSATVFAAIFAAFGLVGCEEATSYKIDAPSDLQDRIDSIAAANERGDTGDTTYIDIATTTVGADDCSSGWNTVFSDYFTVPTNNLLHLEFINHNGGSTSNWNNWNLSITNVEARAVNTDIEGCYFVLRSDAYGWGGTMADVNENYAFDLGLISIDYPDTDGDGDIWNDFRTTMDGAYVTMEIDHSATGNVYVTATAEGTNGTVITETYQQGVSASDDIFAFLVCDASYFEMQEAYLIPSKVTEVEDVMPASIVVTGTPTAVEQSDDLTIGDFWGDGIATVTFADGSSTEVDTADVVFNVIPDMTELGEKTVVVSYSMTKQGNYGPAVSTVYTVEVTNPVTALEITTMPTTTTYAFYGTEAPAFDPTDLVVTATYSDGSKGELDNSSLEFDIPLTAGAQNITVSYVGATSTVTTTIPVTVVAGVDQIGATDLTSAYYGEVSDATTLANSESKVYKMYLYSSGGGNWNGPCIILGNTVDGSTYGVTRIDNWINDKYDATSDSFSSVTGYTGTSDWNWDIFASSLNGSYVEVTVTNNGDDTAVVRYDVTYTNGDTHYQLYENIPITSSDFTSALTIDGCYVVIVE